MARHEITIPVNKSSNSGNIIFRRSSQGGNFYPPMISNTLYASNLFTSSEISAPTSVNNLGIGWDVSLIPQNKNIVNTKVFIYSKYYLSLGLVFKKSEFYEGVNIPSIDSSDGVLTDLSSGWNVIDYNGDLEGSVILGVASPIRHGLAEWADKDYWGEIYSHRASNYKPYVVVTYDDIPPDAPSSLYPSNITISTRDVIRFSWLHNSVEDSQQKAFEMQYSTNGGSTWTTISEITSNQYYDMPANTLPTEGTVLWRVRTIDRNDEVSEYETATFILGIVPQKEPIPISPISQYVEETRPVRFEWNFVGGSGNETQSKFDLQYSTNGGSTWATKTATTSETYYELPANTFSGGNVTWRVRTYNNWNEASPYSDNKSFTVIGSPSIPLISSVTNSARPTITWQATGQHIYELQILQGEEVIFNSGSIPSTNDRSIKVPVYLKDGNYTTRLRIFNEYNLYSPWAEKAFTISTLKPTKPIAEVFSGEYSVTIKTSNTSLRTLVYRDDICIGEVINNHFVDCTGENEKEHQYFIRTINASDNFNDSDIKIAKCKFSGNTLALANDPEDFVKLKYGLDSLPKKNSSISNQGSLVYYDGRTYPVTEHSEFRSKSKILSFTLRTKLELDKLIQLIESKDTLLYRDVEGEIIYGSVFSLDYERGILGYYQVGFTITKTDYKGVAYD